MSTVSQGREKSTRRATSAFVVLNAKSGRGDSALARRTLERHLSVVGIAYRFHEPSHEDPLIDRIREAVNSGCDLVVAAGGDGTVSAVADALAGTETPLGIVALGTANVLAGELGIPIVLEDACALLASEHALTRIDTMELNGKHYVTQVGVGLDAEMIRGTRDEHKRRFGRIAYLWTAATRLIGVEPRRFLLKVDGQTSQHRAMQVLVANSGTLGSRPFRWGQDIRPDDGRVDVCVIRAQNLGDILKIGWRFLRKRHKGTPGVKYLSAARNVTIETRRPMPVQADGEIVGKTPVTIKVIPGAVRVVVPLDTATTPG